MSDEDCIKVGKLEMKTKQPIIMEMWPTGGVAAWGKEKKINYAPEDPLSNWLQLYLNTLTEKGIDVTKIEFTDPLRVKFQVHSRRENGRWIIVYENGPMTMEKWDELLKVIK